MAEIRRTLPAGTPVEIWFQDEMRVGQKNKLTYAGPGRGLAHGPRMINERNRPICSVLSVRHWERAAIVVPSCNSEAMQHHLDVTAASVAPGAHAIMLLDQAGWHGASCLQVPSNISLLPLPPRSPELNAQENIWQFMRQNWLSNPIFTGFDNIVDLCCDAWNRLTDQRWKIMAIAYRQWTVIGQAL